MKNEKFKEEIPRNATGTVLMVLDGKANLSNNEQKPEEPSPWSRKVNSSNNE